MNKYPFFTTVIVVLVAIWIWSKFATKKIVDKAKGTPGGSVAVDTGEFVGPNIDPMTGQYTGPGVAAGATSYASQPVGIQ